MWHEKAKTFTSEKGLRWQHNMRNTLLYNFLLCIFKKKVMHTLSILHSSFILKYNNIIIRKTRSRKQTEMLETPYFTIYGYITHSQMVTSSQLAWKLIW